jgi:hypothetical protein
VLGEELVENLLKCIENIVYRTNLFVFFVVIS